MSYTLKEQLANPGNYGGSRNASQIRYLVYHYTGNDGDRAANNAKSSRPAPTTLSMILQSGGLCLI